MLAIKMLRWCNFQASFVLASVTIRGTRCGKHCHVSVTAGLIAASRGTFHSLSRVIRVHAFRARLHSEKRVDACHTGEVGHRLLCTVTLANNEQK